VISPDVKTSFDYRQTASVAGGSNSQGYMQDRARHIQGFMVQPLWRFALNFAGQNRTKILPKLRTIALSMS